MDEKKDSKDIIAEALLKLLERKSLENITAYEIVEKSGLSRRTFYNKFRDKYTVVEWIFLSHYKQHEKYFGEYLSWYRFTLEMSKTVKENKCFYKNVFRDRELTERLADITCGRFVNAIRRNNDITDEKLLPKKARFLSDFYCHAYMHELAVWTSNGFKETPEELLDLFYLTLSEEFKRLLKLPKAMDV